jgi:hypothetical protein
MHNPIIKISVYFCSTFIRHVHNYSASVCVCLCVCIYICIRRCNVAVTAELLRNDAVSGSATTGPCTESRPQTHIRVLRIKKNKNCISHLRMARRGRNM